MSSYMNFYTVVVSDDNGDTLWSGEFSTEDLQMEKMNDDALTVEDVLETAWNEVIYIPLDRG